MNHGGTFYSPSSKRASIDPHAFDSSAFGSSLACNQFCCAHSYDSTTLPPARHRGSRAVGDGDVGVKVDDDDDDDFYTSKLSKLSLDERSNGLHDLHGVADLKEETPEMLQSKLEEMNEALTSPPGESWAYKIAVSRSPEYVEHLKIPCLRAKEYNSEQAVALLIRLFNRKLELFGESKLAEEIHMSDVTEEENEAIRKGVMQFLPERDRAGRSLAFMNGKLSAEYSTRTVMRIMFQGGLYMVADEETQKRGAVFIYHGIGQDKFYLDRPFEFAKAAESIPIRVVALHLCSDVYSGPMKTAERFLHRAMDGRTVSRYRLHLGTSLECRYKLMTFGIPKDAIPVSLKDGTMDLSWHLLRLKEWEALERLKRREQVAAAKAGKVLSPSDIEKKLGLGPILVPMQLDVMMGRGHHPKNKPGALRMHSLVLERREAYDAAAKLGKTAIAKDILREMKEMGSRFLISAPGGGYMESDDTAAREKISASFRNLRLKEASSASRRRGTKENSSRKRRVVS